MLNTSDAQASEAETARLASILLALETCPASSFSLTSMSVRDLFETKPRAVVICAINGVRRPLTPSDARMIARCLRLESAFAGAATIAAAFDDAVVQAELEAANRWALAPGGRPSIGEVA